MDATASPDAAVQQIVADPALLAEAKAVLPDLKRIATALAGEDGVRRVIAKRFETYPQPQRSDEQWAAWWADYYDVLADLSLASLEAGMRAWVARRDSEFMPKPGQLRELAFSAPCRSLGRYYRARMALQVAEEKPALAGPRVDPTDVHAMMSDFRAGIRLKKDRAPLPPISGQTDEGGLTPQMRALIERRQSENSR